MTDKLTPSKPEPDFDLGELGRVTVETTADAILLLDDEARILFANTATSRLFRYTPAELIGLSLVTLVPQASGQCGVAEFMGVGKNGEELPVGLAVDVHRVSERSIFTVCVPDIRDRKRAEMMRTLLGSACRSAERSSRRGAAGSGQRPNAEDGTTLTFTLPTSAPLQEI